MPRRQYLILVELLYFPTDQSDIKRILFRPVRYAKSSADIDVVKGDSYPLIHIDSQIEQERHPMTQFIDIELIRGYHHMESEFLDTL